MSASILRCRKCGARHLIHVGPLERRALAAEFRKVHRHGKTR